MTISDRYDAPTQPRCQRCNSTNLAPYGAGHHACRECDHTQERA